MNLNFPFSEAIEVKNELNSHTISAQSLKVLDIH